MDYYIYCVVIIIIIVVVVYSIISCDVDDNASVTIVKTFMRTHLEIIELRWPDHNGHKILITKVGIILKIMTRKLRVVT